MAVAVDFLSAKWLWRGGEWQWLDGSGLIRCAGTGRFEWYQSGSGSGSIELDMQECDNLQWQWQWRLTVVRGSGSGYVAVAWLDASRSCGHFEWRHIGVAERGCVAVWLKHWLGVAVAGWQSQLDTRSEHV
jgi:hypothetical protein